MPVKSLVAAALFAVPAVLLAAEPAANDTAINSRDQSGESLTPIDQSNAAADIKITAETRKLVIADDTLSLDAKNCKIITTAGGVVTLRGPVDSAEEKSAVAKHATAAGATSVTNQLEIKQPK